MNWLITSLAFSTIYVGIVMVLGVTLGGMEDWHDNG